MKEIQTKSTKILVVDILDNIDKYTKNFSDIKFVGKLSELTDENCEQFVEFKNVMSSCNCEYCGFDVDCYRDYLNQSDDDWDKYSVSDSLSSAKDSFLSLLEFNKIESNKEYLIIKIT